MPDLLPFVRDSVSVAPPRAVTAEPAYLAALAFAALRDLLEAAVPFFDRLRTIRGPWGVPELFYFDRLRDAEYLRGGTTDDAERKAAAKEPTAHRAASLLPDRLDDVLTLAYQGPELRCVLWATERLPALVEAWAGEHPKLAELDRVRRLTDDDVLRVIHPGRRQGYRVTVNGIATVRQFHELFAALVDPTPTTAEHDWEPTFTARRQFVRPQALGAAGSIEGWAAVDHWLWGLESLRTLPRLDGDRLMLIAEPTLEAAWISERNAPGVRPEATILDEMTTRDVEEFLRTWTGRTERPRLRRAA